MTEQPFRGRATRNGVWMQALPLLLVFGNNYNYYTSMSQENDPVSMDPYKYSHTVIMKWQSSFMCFMITVMWDLNINWTAM